MSEYLKCKGCSKLIRKENAITFSVGSFHMDCGLSYTQGKEDAMHNVLEKYDLVFKKAAPPEHE